MPIPLSPTAAWPDALANTKPDLAALLHVELPAGMLLVRKHQPTADRFRR